MTEYGYVRGSTDTVDVENQYMVLTEAGIKPHNIYSDVAVSGTISPSQRQGWARLDALLQAGDTLTIRELSRVGRGMRFIPAVLEDMHIRGIRIRSLAPNESWVKYFGSDDPAEALYGGVMAQFAGYMAQMYRDELSRNTKAGLRRAKAQGKVIGGGHYKLNPAEREALRQDRRRGLSWRKIQERYGVGETTARRIMREGAPAPANTESSPHPLE